MLTGIAPHADRNRRYTLKETASLLGIHRNTLRRYIKEGRIDIVLAAGHAYVSGADINQFWNTTL
jgi:excisionase family DNA binding protein